MNIPPNSGAGQGPPVPTIVISPAPEQEATPAAAEKPRVHFRQAPAAVSRANSAHPRPIGILAYRTALGTAGLEPPLVPPEELPGLIAEAVEWAVGEERRALANGSPLDRAQTAIARQMGVREPKNIRLVHTFDPPASPKLCELMAGMAMLEQSIGKAFGYGVFMKKGSEHDPVLLSHELRHVRQCEDFGGIAEFTKTYVEQLNAFGYRNCGIEQDAYRNQLKRPGKPAEQSSSSSSSAQSG
jgi:hypothetical protein